MKLTTTITPTDIIEGSFTDDKTKEEIKYFQVQFMTKVMKKVGEEYREFDDVMTCSCRKEAAELLEVGTESIVEVNVKAQQPKAGGFPIVKYSIVGVE